MISMHECMTFIWQTNNLFQLLDDMHASKRAQHYQEKERAADVTEDHREVSQGLKRMLPSWAIRD